MSDYYHVCSHCGTTFHTTDIYSYRCGPCRRKGHTIPGAFCEVCNKHKPENPDPLNNLEHLISIQNKRKAYG